MSISNGTPTEYLPVFIDADILTYRCSFHAKDGVLDDALNKADELVEMVVDKVHFGFPNWDLLQFHLTGKGNFRYDIAKSHTYKGNRKDTERPPFINEVRDYFVGEYGAIVSHGEEADDAIARGAASYSYDCVIASTDKDFMQVPCWIYNWGRDTWYKPTEVDGLKAFYGQILTGDTSDNIVGLSGIGPKKAEKALKDCDTEGDMYEVCLKYYEGDVDRVIENARLLWLRREEGEIWEPPTVS